MILLYDSRKSEMPRGCLYQRYVSKLQFFILVITLGLLLKGTESISYLAVNIHLDNIQISDRFGHLIRIRWCLTKFYATGCAI